MPSIFSDFKKRIDAFLLAFLYSKKESLAQVHTFGPNVIERITQFIGKGKTIRGSLVCFAYELSGKTVSEDALRLAAAVELVHLAFLVHDDIMDRDTNRRGIPSLHVQYKSEPLAMCVGDALIFLAYELIGTIKTDAETLGRIVRLASREYTSVCIAQMADVAKSAKTKKDIFNLYTYKTGRYTFAVPLMLGAVLAGTTKKMLQYLESYGVSVGVLFQIRDDELDHATHPFTKADIDGLRSAATKSIQRLPITDTDKTILHDMLTFTTERTA